MKNNKSAHKDDEKINEKANALVAILDGFSLRGAIQAIRTAEQILIDPHRVDAQTAIGVRDGLWDISARAKALCGSTVKEG